MRSKLGGPSLGDDELLMRYVAGNQDVDAMRTAGPPTFSFVIGVGRRLQRPLTLIMSLLPAHEVKFGELANGDKIVDVASEQMSADPPRRQRD
jgi:hypothetical protein